MDATVKLFWDVYHQQWETSGQNWVKIGIFDRYTHSLTYLLIPKANMATPTIGGRGRKKKEVLSWFSVVCIIGDWNFALILLRWRDASPWSFFADSNSKGKQSLLSREFRRASNEQVCEIQKNWCSRTLQCGTLGVSEEYRKHISFDISADFWNAEVKIHKQIIKQENSWTLVNGKNTNCNFSAVVLHVKPSCNITWALSSSPQ